MGDSMMKTWQLSMGRSDINYINKVCDHFPTGLLNYDKGSANMKLLPKLGDEVYVTCRAKLRCIGVVCRDFHIAFNPILKVNELCLTVMLTKVVKEGVHLKGRRRNWTLL